MARFFMHLINDTGETPDHEGVELADEDTARLRATSIVRELIADDVRAGRNQIHLTLRVEDEAGCSILILKATAEISGI